MKDYPTSPNQVWLRYLLQVAPRRITTEKLVRLIDEATSAENCAILVYLVVTRYPELLEKQ